MRKGHFTSEVAKRIGVSKLTLVRWLHDGKISEPQWGERYGLKLRLWSEGDVARARQYKEENYRKGRGRKERS